MSGLDYEEQPLKHGFLVIRMKIGFRSRETKNMMIELPGILFYCLP
jgi:hypothetical protein